MSDDDSVYETRDPDWVVRGGWRRIEGGLPEATLEFASEHGANPSLIGSAPAPKGAYWWRPARADAASIARYGPTREHPGDPGPRPDEKPWVGKGRKR